MGVTVAPLARALLAFAAAVAGCGGDSVHLGGGPPPFACNDRCFIDRDLPPDAGEWFYGRPAADDLRPQVVYPLPDSTHPYTLQELTVQWRRFDRAQTTHRLRFDAPRLKRSYEFFVPCLATAGEGCRYTLAEALFTEMTFALRGQDVVLTVSATDRINGPVATSDALHLRFTPEPLENAGLYYWGELPPPSQGVGVTYRLPFGARRPAVFIEPGTSTNPLGCSGCHTISRDGSTIAFTARTLDPSEDQRTGQLVVTQTNRPNEPLVQPATEYDSSMMALTSDGRRVLVAYDNQLVLRHTAQNRTRDIEAGAVITDIPSSLMQDKYGFFPEFSPNDDRIVLTLSDDPDSPHAVRNGDIAVMAYDDESAGAATPGEADPETIFGAAEVLVPGGDGLFHFYPTWSPDGKYIAFVSAPVAEGSISYDQRDGWLRLLRLEDGMVFDLERATQSVGSWTTLPKFAPFPPDQQGGLLFLTYNSKIDYGLLLSNSDKPDEAKFAQLWMAAIDPARLPQDPSSAPVWLPFQNFTHQSHFGYWTDRVSCRLDVDPELSCGPGADCVESGSEGGFCVVEPR